jgi:hypothetical protein
MRGLRCRANPAWFFFFGSIRACQQINITQNLDVEKNAKFLFDKKSRICYIKCTFDVKL